MANQRDLDTMMQAAFERKQAAENAQIQAEQQKIQAIQQQEIDGFRAQLESQFSADVLTLLNVEYAVTEDHAYLSGYKAFARLTYKDVAWKIRETHYGWELDGAGYSYSFCSPFIVSLADQVLGRMRAWELEEAEREARKEAERNAYIERCRLNDERHAQEEVERQKIADEEERHIAIIQAEYDAAVKAAKETIWQWPEGVTITIYRWTYQDGHDEDGNADHSQGWSLTDTLDEKGYVTFIPECCVRSKTIKLVPDVHLPVVESCTFSNTAELPDQLTDEYHYRVNFTREYSPVLMRYVLQRSDSPDLHVKLGDTPIAYLRGLIEIQAAKEK